MPSLFLRRWLKTLTVSAFAVFVVLLKAANAYTTVGDTAHPDQLYSAIMNVYNSGGTGVTINAGVYNIPVSTTGYTWTFSAMSNFTINAPNVRLVFSDAAYNEINFYHCVNFTFQGAIISAAIPNFTQGRIYNAGSDAQGPYIDVQIDAGYPIDWTNTVHWPYDASRQSQFTNFQVFDSKTRRYKPGTGDYGATLPPATLNAANRQYRFHTDGNNDFLPANHLVVNGDIAGFRGGGSRFFNIDGCSNLLLQDLVVNTGGIGSWQCGNGLVTINRCNFVYQTPPVVGSAIGVFGPTGMASGNNSTGLHMTNSLWQGSDDDVINDDANPGYTGQVNGATLTFGQGYCPWRAGDTVYFYDPSGNFLGQNTIVTTPIPNSAYTPPDNTYAGWGLAWRNVTLARPVSLAYKSRVIDLNWSGANFTLKNDVFQNYRDIGVIVCSSNADIENCVFDGGTVSAIASENFSNNMVIKNNVLTNNCLRWNYGNTEGGRNAGAIQIDDGYDTYGGVQGAGLTLFNTLIQNNAFVGNGTINIGLENAASTGLLGNAFFNTHPAGPGAVVAPVGIVNGQDSNCEIWMKNDYGITLAGNVVGNVGPYGTQLAEISSGCSSILGASSGVTLQNPTAYYAKNAVVNHGVVYPTGASGSGYVGGLDYSDSSVTFTVNAPVAGTYPIIVYYDNASTDVTGHSVTATHSIVVNGNAGSPIPISYPFTGPWGVFDTTYVTAAFAPLNAGSNTLQFKQATNKAELDNIQIPGASASSSLVQDADINSPAIAGGATFSSGGGAVSGAGWDIWGSSDQFNFASQPFTGNGTAIVHVASFSSGDYWAKAGLMLRENLTPGSRMVMALAANHAESQVNARVSAGQNAQTTGDIGTGVGLWYKLVRSGDQITAYSSADGASWTSFGSPVTLAGLSQEVFVGMAVTSTNQSALATAVFDHFSIAP